MVEDEITARLGEVLGIRVVLHRAVGSTMETAGEDRGSRPVIHVADSQTEGRGRRGRGWISPPGNLYSTIVWPDPEHLIHPGVLGAIQVEWSEAIASAGGPETQCKWPNDGIVEGHKWAGALAIRSRGPEGEEVHIGLGANLSSHPGKLEPGGLPAATLREHWDRWPGTAAVRVLLLESVVSLLREGEAGIEARLDRWRERDALTVGEPIRLDLPESSIEGRYAGTGARGELLVESEGRIHRLEIGEVRRLTQPD